MKDDMFDDLLKSVKAADKILKGRKKARRIFEIAPPDIVGIRKKLKVSQETFARMIGVSEDTLQNWEQERRKPRGAALPLLTMFKNDPKAAYKALHPDNKQQKD
jgi:putative transcriptional regulator